MVRPLARERWWLAEDRTVTGGGGEMRGGRSSGSTVETRVRTTSGHNRQYFHFMMESEIFPELLYNNYYFTLLLFYRFYAWE